MAVNAKVAIVIPVFNGGKYLAESVESALNQNYHNVKLYILDDGSQDDSYQILSKFKMLYPEKIVLRRNKSNYGVTQAIVDLCKIASLENEIAVLLSQDDILLSNHVSSIVPYFMQSNDVVVTCRAKLIDEYGRFSSVIHTPPRLSALKFLKTGLLLNVNLLNACGVAFGLRSFNEKELGENNPLTQDWNHWIYLSLKYKFVVSSKTIVLYRKHAKSITGMADPYKCHKEISDSRMRFLESKQFQEFIATMPYLKRKLFFFFVRLNFGAENACHHNVAFLAKLRSKLLNSNENRSKRVYDSCGKQTPIIRHYNKSAPCYFETHEATSISAFTHFLNEFAIFYTTLRVLSLRIVKVSMNPIKRKCASYLKLKLSSTGGTATQLVTLSYAYWIEKNIGRKVHIIFYEKGLSLYPLAISDLLSDFPYEVRTSRPSLKRSEFEAIDLKIKFGFVMYGKVKSCTKKLIKQVFIKTNFIVSSHFLTRDSLNAVSRHTLKVQGYSTDWGIVSEVWPFLSRRIDQEDKLNFMRNAGKEKAIAVHWRIGDYLENDQANYTHGVILPECIVNCIEYASEVLQTKKVIVFSDSPLVARDWLSEIQSRFEITFESTDVWQDLFKMTRSSGFIGSNSGVSAWAALSILASNPKALVLLPDKWYKNVPEGFSVKDHEIESPLLYIQGVRTFETSFN